MKRHDRIMAITRHPEYLDDWKELQRLRGIDNDKAHAWAEELGRRCGEYPPPRPEWRYDTIIFPEDAAIELIDSIDQEEYTPIQDNYVEMLEAISRVKQKGKRTKAKKEEVPEFRYEGRYLYLRVDLSKKKTHLKQEFKDLVDRYKMYLPEDTRRDTEAEPSPWRVYDMHFEGKNLLQITKELFDIDANPTYDKQAKARYEQVKRLLEKANQMINEIKEIK